MPGPYDSRGKKVNEVNTYDVFGSHKFATDRKTALNHFMIEFDDRLTDYV